MMSQPDRRDPFKPPALYLLSDYRPDPRRLQEEPFPFDSQPFSELDRNEILVGSIRPGTGTTPTIVAYEVPRCL
jgi:hypothetical protein